MTVAGRAAWLSLRSDTPSSRATEPPYCIRRGGYARGEEPGAAVVGIAVDGPILVVDTESPGDRIGASTAEPSGRLFAGCGICSGLPIESVDTGGILDSPSQAVSIVAAQATVMRNEMRIGIVPLGSGLFRPAAMLPQ